MSRPKSARGFTLIEVLVVVAIIALLVAILIPSLTRAREQARAVVCAKNTKEMLHGIMLKKAESQMKKERFSTNFGWAVQSLRQIKGQTELFTCPSDPAPRPVAAVLDRIYEDQEGKEFIGTTSGDAVYSRVLYQNGWITDIQDQVESDVNRPGNDAYDDPAGDLIIELGNPPEGKVFTGATARPGNIAQRHDLMSYKGETLATNISSSVAIQVPLLWMSYGANASAGQKNAKGMSVLIAETGKLGIFPEHLDGDDAINDNNYNRDHLGWVLRFRHGDKTTKQELWGVDWSGKSGSVSNPFSTRPPRLGTGITWSMWKDQNYVPRSRLNAGFTDGHVERPGYWDLMDLQSTAANQRPIPKKNIWFGNRRSNTIKLNP